MVVAVMRKSEREAVIAHHEAGHAVIARVLGLGIAHVTIFSTDPANLAIALTQSATYLTSRDADHAAHMAALEKDAIVCLAGPNAQMRHRRPKNQDDWEDDRRNASSLAAEAVMLSRGMPVPEKGAKFSLPKDLGPEVNQLFEQFRDKSKVLVDEHWPAIVRVAEALLDHHILNETDIDDLIAGKFLARTYLPQR